MMHPKRQIAWVLRTATQLENLSRAYRLVADDMRKQDLDPSCLPHRQVDTRYNTTMDLLYRMTKVIPRDSEFYSE